MINDKKALPPALPHNSAGTKPSSDAPTSLLCLPTEVLLDVFARTMTGNSAQALRQAGSLAVSHPALSAVLAIPGPEQRTYQRLVSQRSIVQAIFDKVPASQRHATLMPLFDILAKSARENLLNDCLVWLERPSIERNAFLTQAEHAEYIAYIKILFSMVPRLDDAKLTDLTQSAAAGKNYAIQATINLKPQLSSMDAATRGRILREADSNLDFARFLLITNHDALSTSEYNRLANAVLSSETICNDLSVDTFGPDSVGKLNQGNLTLLTKALLAGGSKHNSGPSVLVSLLNQDIKLPKKETEDLRNFLIAHYDRRDIPGWDLAYLSIGFRNMNKSVRTQLLPMMTKNLAIWNEPYIAERLLHVWLELDEAQRSGLVDYIDAHMEAICAPWAPNTARDSILIDRAPPALNAIIDKINTARGDMAAAASAQSDRLLRSALEAHTTLEIDDNEDTIFPLLDSLENQELHIVNDFLKKLITESVQVANPSQRFDHFISEFTEKISQGQLNAIYETLMELPESTSKTSALMGLCFRSKHLDAKNLHGLAAWIIKTDVTSYYLNPIIPALHLLLEQGRLSSTSRCGLALWCTDIIAEDQNLFFQELAKIIAQENTLP